MLSKIGHFSTTTTEKYSSSARVACSPFVIEHHNVDHRHSDPPPPKVSSEEFYFRRGSDPHGVGLNPAGESRAGTKKPLECAGNRPPVEVGRTGFVGMRVRRNEGDGEMW